MGLVALFIAFQYTSFFIVQSVFGIDGGGTGLRIFSIIFFALCLITFLFKSERKEKDWWYMIIIAGFLGIITYTRLKFGYTNKDYEGALLSFGVRCVPAVIAGILLAKKQEYFVGMQKWLQVFMLLYTIGVAIAVFTSSESQYLQYRFEAGGLNYQSLSYCSAFAFNMNMYLIFNWDTVRKFKFFDNGFWKNINKLLLLLQIYCMISGGGRGAVINIIVVAVFLIYVKANFNINIKSVFLTVFLATTVCLIIYFIAETTGNSGATRIVSFFTDAGSLFDNDRTKLRQEAMKIFVNNPVVGHGIGSVFYMMGYYSHNMFTDILVEGGIVFIFVAIAILGKSIFNMKSLVGRNANNAMIYMIFFSSFTMLQMSGYYLIDGGLWFAATYFLYTLSDMREEKGIQDREETLREYNKRLKN